MDAVSRKDRKEDIYEAALQCFNENGYYQTSIDTIAEKAHISKGGIYYHFKSKDDLFIKLFAYRCERYLEQVGLEIQAIDDPETRLEQFVHKASGMVVANQDFLRFFLEFMAVGARDPQIHAVMTGYYRNSVANFRRLIESCIQTGRYQDVDAGRLARGVYFCSLGIFFTWCTVQADFNLTDEHMVHIGAMLSAVKNRAP
jgi:AcrR family transcriptional regulator